ncbi:DUF1868 domain-containing protein [Rhizobium oryziradicis]|uniref:DUF1868 domain-containing protein n=1 Tax=Rhizobium oryziradicis TaxID=1867956 RepID=A0A1Q8ZXC3_9HYPH|nr:DUF1868 domain-containing protein [Rhizobium oryziradicis]OLP46729.1 hypothetical protein BJF95_15530 [Rhizobium oryziradicis]
MLISTVKPLDIGRKFHADGAVRHFPGNTIVCHVASQTALIAGLDRLYDRLRQASAAHSYTLLPPSSWHMTLYVGICDQDRRVSRWPNGLTLDAPMKEANRCVEERLRSARFEGPARFRMKVKHFWPLKDGIVLGVEPADESENQAIRALRDQISASFGMRLEDHDVYNFHITMAYFVGQPTDAEFTALSTLLAEELQTLLETIPVFEVGPAEYCLFNDMFCFQRQFYIMD